MARVFKKLKGLKDKVRGKDTESAATSTTSSQQAQSSADAQSGFKVTAPPKKNTRTQSETMSSSLTQNPTKNDYKPEARPSLREINRTSFMNDFIAERDAESSSDSGEGAKGAVFPMSMDSAAAINPVDKPKVVDLANNDQPSVAQIGWQLPESGPKKIQNHIETKFQEESKQSSNQTTATATAVAQKNVSLDKNASKKEKSNEKVKESAHENKPVDDLREETMDFTEPQQFRLIDSFDVVDDVDFSKPRQRTKSKVIVDTSQGGGASKEADKQSSEDVWRGAADDSDDELENMDYVDFSVAGQTQRPDKSNTVRGDRSQELKKVSVKPRESSTLQFASVRDALLSHNLGNEEAEKVNSVSSPTKNVVTSSSDQASSSSLGVSSQLARMERELKETAERNKLKEESLKEIVPSFIRRRATLERGAIADQLTIRGKVAATSIGQDRGEIDDLGVNDGEFDELGQGQGQGNNEGKGYYQRQDQGRVAIVKRKSNVTSTNVFGDLSDDSNFSYDEESDMGDDEIERQLLEQSSENSNQEERQNEEGIKDDHEEGKTNQEDADIEQHRAVKGEDEGVGSSFLNELLQDNNRTRASVNLASEEPEKDILQIIDASEHLFITFAQKKLHENRLLLDQRARKIEATTKAEKLVQQRVLTELKKRPYGQIETQFHRFLNYQKYTCVTLTDEVVVLGMEVGQLWVYERESCKLYARFEDRDFAKNPVTSCHVHPLRTEYLVVGFKGGQLILFDLAEVDKKGFLKVKKQVKDHHKGSSIQTVKFCDWKKEREASDKRLAQQEIVDAQCWMICSVDVEGRVIVTTISEMFGGFLKASKFTILDPVKDQSINLQQVTSQADLYGVLETRFQNRVFPQGDFNDNETWVAIGSVKEVQILVLTHETCKGVFGFKRPNYYPSERSMKYEEFSETKPILAWGFGRTPIFKHRTYSILAIAWGPLIQLVILVPDEEKQDENDHFKVDGQYFIAPGTVQDFVPGTSIVCDIKIEHMAFLAESVLFVYTSTGDIRVLHTQNFANGGYKFPTQMELANPMPNFDQIESLLKLTDVNQMMTKKQMAVEMERRKFLNSPLQQTQFGSHEANTVNTFQDWIVFLTEDGVQSCSHMTWQEYVEHEGQDMQNTWIETFQKALDIFQGKIKGFKGVIGDHDLRQEFMKADLKQLISALIDRVIEQWKVRASKMENEGHPTEQIQEGLKEKYVTLIRRVIELCVEIWEPFFLFNELFYKFMEQAMSELFAQEIKPYILSGTFFDTAIPEAILVSQIIAYPQKQFLESLKEEKSEGVDLGEHNPAETFEKMIINLNFSGCSKDYRNSLIQFCKEHRLSTAHLYLSINFEEDDGVEKALNELRLLYLQLREEETLLGKENPDEIILGDDLIELEKMPANLPKRESFERSAIYCGYKLLWVIRLILLGRRFPKGHFGLQKWQNLLHDVLNLVTEAQFMKTLHEIDAGTYFQIITMVFINPSKQYDFLEHGRIEPPGSSLKNSQAKPSLTHHDLVHRISDYCLKEYPEGSEIRLQFLFFVASIAAENQEMRDNQFYYNVTLELLRHSHQFLTFNRSLLERQMSRKQMYRRLSRRGVAAPDAVKHIVLSEESIMTLLLKCEPLDKQLIDKLVEVVKITDFDSIKLMLYEKQEAYTKCLKLLVTTESSSSFVSQKMRDRYAWIIDKYFMLEKRLASRNENTKNRYQFDLFEQEIFSYAPILTKISPHKAVGLISCLFNDSHLSHLAFIEKMDGSKQEQYLYTKMLLEVKSDEVKKIIQDYTLTSMNQTEAATIWKRILCLNLELACQIETAEVLRMVKLAIKAGHYPLEDFLRICEKFDATEACAVLCKKLGQYKESVNHYIKLIRKSIKIDEFKKELYGLDMHIRTLLIKQKQQLMKREQKAYEEQIKRAQANQKSDTADLSHFQQLSTDIDSLIRSSTAQLVPDVFTRENSQRQNIIDSFHLKLHISGKCPNINLLERVLRIITKLFTSHAEQVLKQNDDIWLNFIGLLFSLTQNEKLHKKRYCRRYLIVKMVSLVRIILKYISFEKVVDGFLSAKQNIRYRAVKQLISEVFWDKRAEVDLCKNASDISTAELRALTVKVHGSQGNGLLYRYTRCDICGASVALRFDRVAGANGSLLPGHYRGSAAENEATEGIIVFDCVGQEFNHVFHERCINAKIKDELSKDKKASLGTQEIQKALRCVMCYSQSFELNGEQMGKAQASPSVQIIKRMGTSRRSNNQSAKNMKVGSAENSSKQQNHLQLNESMSSADSSSNNALNRSSSRFGVVKQKTMAELRQENMMQSMDMFEKQMDFDTLDYTYFE